MPLLTILGTGPAVVAPALLIAASVPLFALTTRVRLHPVRSRRPIAAAAVLAVTAMRGAIPAAIAIPIAALEALAAVASRLGFRPGRRGDRHLRLGLGRLTAQPTEQTRHDPRALRGWHAHLGRGLGCRDRSRRDDRRRLIRRHALDHGLRTRRPWLLGRCVRRLLGGRLDQVVAWRQHAFLVEVVVAQALDF